MSFKRKILIEPKTGDELTRDMIGIGIQFSGEATKNPNIEDTIFSSSYEGITRKDYRVLAMVTLWLEKHFFLLNADRLIKLIESKRENEIFIRYWVAVSQWQGSDIRFRKLAKLFDSSTNRKEISKGVRFLVSRHGEDQRFKGTSLIVPKNMLENRNKKWLVVNRDELSRRHISYRWRLVIGPTFRADLWSELEVNSTLSAAELARQTYSSYCSAHRVKRDYDLFSRSVALP